MKTPNDIKRPNPSTPSLAAFNKARGRLLFSGITVNTGRNKAKPAIRALKRQRRNEMVAKRLASA